MKPGWIAFGIVAAAAGVGAGAPALAKRMSFFRVRRVEFVGLRYAAPAELLPALRIPASMSVFDDTRSIAARARAIRGVARVTVGRRLPGTLRIEVDEMAAVAVTPVGDAMRLLDARGRLLPFDPARSGADLPVAETVDAVVARLLARVQEFDPTLFERVATARREQQDVVLDVGGKSLRFRPDASAEDMRLVTAVEDKLSSTGRSYRELDGRFAGQVIVRGGA